MLIRSDRRHHFDASPEDLWAALRETDRYRAWWPWLRAFEATGFAVGDVWRCTIQPPLPYSLRLTVTIDDIVEGESVAATVGGDIVGAATVAIAAWGPGSEAHLVSELAPANRMLLAVARMARPVVRFGHDWVLDTGAHQFRARALPP